MLFFLQIISYELENDIGTIPLNLDSGLGFFDALIASLSMILVSEIGDENFIIAALMAMRYPKSTVLSDALSALFVMTVLSTGLGRIVPNLISRKHTNSAATGLPDNVLQKAAAKSIVFEAVYGKHRKESEDNLPVDHCVDRMMMLIPSLLSFTANLSSEADGVRSLTALQRQARLLTH